MNSNVTRRNFVVGAAACASMMGLAACGTTTGSASKSSAPAASSYPISPDGSSVKAKYTSETLRKDKWTRYTNPDGGAEIGVMDTSKIIQVDGLAFKDMNGNGKLDLYEDWRQSDEDRAKALAEALSAEEILPLMWHNGFTSTAAPLNDDSVATIKQGMRAGVSRAQANSTNYADAINWINAVQEECEKDGAYGIPYLNSTDQYQNYDIPDNIGIAASMDMDLIRRAGDLQAKTWRDTGVRCLLGPQIDVASNPVWCRFSGTLSEDPALNRDFARAFISGLQSTYDSQGNDTGWGSDSILGMAKHYVGAGAVEGGRNDHTDQGKYDVFPGENFKAHLIPFLDGALNLGTKTGATAAIMPNYAIAYSETQEYGENVGGGFSELRNGYLRKAGWDGMITTDWQITLDTSQFGAGMKNRIWGVEDLTPTQRQLKGIKADDDQFGGEFSVDTITEAYASLKKELGDDEALKRLRESARRIFTVMNRVDLFDNPYTDRAAAETILSDSASKAFGVEAAEKSMVMLKNVGNVISKNGLGNKPKTYISQVLKGGGMMSSTPAAFELAIDKDVANANFDVVTDVVGAPTGTSVNMMTKAVTTGVYQSSDASLPSDADLAQCKYAIVFVNNPNDANDGSVTNPDGTVTYHPYTLQYRPYTADGDNVRRVSLAGNNIESKNGAVWDKTTGGAKENRSYFGQSSTAKNESDLDKVIAIRSKLPADAKLILVVEATKPMCFHEIEPYADVILMQFKMEQGINSTALANIITGKAEPKGLLIAQMPKDMSQVEGQDEDVPRDMVCYKDAAGNSYDFAFGLNWSGVISDDRTKTYQAKALTKPEASYEK